MAAQRTAAAMAQAAVAASTPPGSAGGPKPYVCNWVAGQSVFIPLSVFFPIFISLFELKKV